MTLTTPTHDFTLVGVTLIEDGEAIENAAIVVKTGQIVYAGPLANLSPLPADRLISGQEWLVASGFIDLQLNGAYGLDFTRQPETISTVAARLPETGVVAFLPTFITSPLDTYPDKLAAVTAAQRKTEGALVLGAHVEGPFLNPVQRGAHNAAWICPPTPATLAHLFPLEAVRLLTLAPEQPDGLAAVRWLRQQGVIVSAGHSGATAAEAEAAFEAGVTYGTHLFNAMSPLHHREPGLPGALLTSTQVKCGLIADGIHVHPQMLRLAWQCRGAAGLTLVTDAMAAMGMPPGEYGIGDQVVLVDKTGARLHDGRLAGSILQMDEAVRNTVAFTGCSAAAAIRMASTTPAEVLGLSHQMGHVRPGYPANLVILNRSLQVQATFIAGEVKFAAPEIYPLFH